MQYARTARLTFYGGKPSGENYIKLHVLIRRGLSPYFRPNDDKVVPMARKYQVQKPHERTRSSGQILFLYTSHTTCPVK